MNWITKADYVTHSNSIRFDFRQYPFLDEQISCRSNHKLFIMKRKHDVNPVMFPEIKNLNIQI